jgi:transposase
MDVLYARCCGLDVHKKTVFACRITPGPAGTPHKEVREFTTMSGDILALGDWLAESGCTHIAMESTGVYWKPLYNLLEGRFTLLLVNAQHVKTVPGRKSDVRDCEWLADLLRHGLLRASFVPDQPQREVRELIRYRTSVVRARAAEANRLQKTLEGANIKLAAVATDILGVSGRAMLEALVAGTTDPVVLADLAQKRLREKIPQLVQALDGRVGAHQRFMIAQHLAQITFFDESIQALSREVAERMRPFEQEIALLDTIPGINQWMAEVIVAEIGVDMTRFPTAGHLASWAGMVPGQHESAGKRRSTRTRKGSPWLRAALVEIGFAAGHTKDTYPNAQYHRLVARRGKKKAVVAVGHTILEIIYVVLKRQEPYHDLGADYFDERAREAVKNGAIHRLKRLGYEVTLSPKEAA